ncbi:hypothetical protein [Staphylococcus kloosii]|uniref:hypothetical protein n=1 Tax=Staphylococcus kloosii TaxID=29384 RepID=UPI0028A49936|nr:hypothetical protein [Staphylococcus kloosii]MDT3958714.1 hypothetical protein [Staphylococcus kloosii]
MLYVVIIVAILLCCFGIHQYFNLNIHKKKYPSIIFSIIGFVLYSFVAIVQYKTDCVNNHFFIHELLVISLYGILLFWLYAIYKRLSIVYVYTVAIMILSLFLVLNTYTPNLTENITMLIARLILTILLLIIGSIFIIKRDNNQQSENIPIYYLFSFIYWLVIAYLL